MTKRRSLAPANRVEMPEEFKRFFDLPEIVADETHEGYYELHAAIANYVKPADIFGWFRTNDAVEADRAVRYYRRTKALTILSTKKEILEERENKRRLIGYRIEAMRVRALAETEAASPDQLHHRTTEDAKPELAKSEVITEDPYLLAEVFLRRGSELERLDKLIADGEKKRDRILRERYRDRGCGPEAASSDIIDAEFTEE
jgi:hypothetical protein